MRTQFVYERITDEEIDSLAQGREIISHYDFNLKRNSKYEKNRLFPVVGGVYDSDYFGSIYTDTCNCGRTKTINTLCQRCCSRVLPEEEKYKRYAKIELDFYYVLGTKIAGLVGLLADLPLNYSAAAEFLEFSRLSKSSAPRMCDLCQFEWDENLQEIVVNPYVTDESKASYEGLELILKEHFPEQYKNFSTLVNKKILVIPAVYRMASFNPFDPLTKISIPLMSSYYQSIVYMKETIRNLSEEDIVEPMERVVLKATLRAYAAKFPYLTSEALSPSKENIFRTVMSSRIDNSGRAPIVGDPTLAIDEVQIPIHLAYEICKIDFINYLSNKLGITLTKAETKYRKASKDVIELFKLYAPTRRVIVNRPPSLHRYNNMSFKMFVTEDQAIHFPITSVEPFAADFDGDAVSFFLVPMELNQLCDDNASPATQLRYESNDAFIWRPNQDMLFGLTLSTRITPSDRTDIPKYMSYMDMEKDYNDQVIMYPTDLVYLNGTLTTYARETVSAIIRRDISDLYGAGYVNAKNISVLLTYLYSLKDFTEVYQKLVEFALEVLTLEGATVPSLVEMISVDTSEFTDRMRELVERSKEDPKYFLELEQEYEKFINQSIKDLSQDLSRRIADSGRMKIQQITDMMCPQMTVNKDGEYYIAEQPLVRGLSHEDYVHHAVNNRAILQMKQALTPNAGYCNRQLIHAGQGIQMERTAEQKPNPGVWIPRKRAEGRTTVDGEVLGASDSDELVLVKSYALGDGVMTPDLISETYNSFGDQSNIGLKFTSGVAGSITQGALSLKHQGILRKLDSHVQLVAKADCTVRRKTLDTIEITEVDGTRYTHFIPSDFILANPEGQINKGEIIGFRPSFIDPGFKGRSMIDLLGALNTDDIENPRQIDFSLCVAPIGGRVRYDMNYIYIDELAIPRNPERVYYFFEGEVIPKYSIICDGTLDCRNIAQYCPHDRDYYGCFRAFFLSILPDINEQTVEYVFSTINSRNSEGRLTYTGVKDKVRKDKSIITNIGYEGAGRIIQEILASPEPIEEGSKSRIDIFSQYYLNLLIDHV